MKTKLIKNGENSPQNITEILLVEDSLTQATHIKHLLESHNYKVSVSQNGKLAMDWLSDHKPSLVISDILMPEMNGYELCRKIKMKKKIADIPVILLTRLVDPEEIIEGLSCGADSFITKPFNKKYLLSHIEKILSEEKGADSEKVLFGTQILFKGKKRYIQAEQQNVIRLILDIYDAAIQQNEILLQTQEELRLLNERLESEVEDRTAELSIEIKTSNEIARRLKESEENLQSAMENSADAIFVTDQKGRYIYTNKAVSDMLGYTSDEMKSKTIFDVSPQNKKEEYIEIFKQILSDGKIFTEIELLKKDGYFISTDLNSVLLPGGLVYASCRDITKRKLAEQSLKHAKEMAEANDKLKTTFLHNISHEVRTPLNGILGFAEIISQPDLSAENKKESLAMLQESSNRLLNTITNYVDISLITSRSMSVHEEVFIPGNVLRKIYKNYYTICADKKLELFLEIPGQAENLIINSDRELFQKIVIHLLKNAIKFTEKGSIHFGFIILEKEIEFFVKDTGIGIGKESLEIVFDHFIKEEHGPLRIFEGSGLGLSIAKGIIEIIGGKIRVESQIEVGSSFFFTIPLMANTETFLYGAPVREPEKIVGEDLILVAEDDETNFVYLNALLISITGVTILHASNGREAIELFKANQGIKLILMDIKMPVIDGLEATKQIKLLNKEVPVIAITSYAMLGDESRILSAGCDGYMSKPISKKDLFEKLAEYINL